MAEKNSIDRVNEMTARKSFLMVARLIIVLFAIQFVRDAFYKWDGYSYYMRFRDFLPELSLAYILWISIGIMSAICLWVIIYSLYKIIPKFLTADRFELLMTLFILVFIILVIKRTYFQDFSLSGLTGLSHSTTLLVGGFLIMGVVWLVRRHVKNILEELDSRITPLIWIFAIMLIIALPFTFLRKGPDESEYKPDDKYNLVSANIKRPNIILVTWDALTALDMGVYGFKRPTTPFIKEWAKDAVVFNRAYSSSNWTSASSMSMMTGEDVWTHGVWYFAGYHPVSDYKKNMARVLRDYGYDVYALTQNIYAHPGTLGMGRYFQVKNEERTFHVPDEWWFFQLGKILGDRAIAREWIFGSFFGKQLSAFSPHRTKPYRPSENVYEPFLELMSERKSGNSQKPFFAWIHTHAPHDPYIPTEPFLGVFEENNNDDLPEILLSQTVGRGEYDLSRQPEVDIIRKRYDEFILYSDKQFELFMSRLSGIIDMSRTIVIFSSDHGESFSHGIRAHIGKHLYEPIVHIPLIIKIPEKVKGRKVDEKVIHTDFAPTILGLAGIPVPEWMEGRSLLSLIEGEPFEPRPIFSMQFLENRALGNPIIKGTIAVWQDDYKLIYYLGDDKKLLFNLKTDPGETKNIFNEKHEIARGLFKLIDDNLKKANARIAGTMGYE